VTAGDGAGARGSPPDSWRTGQRRAFVRRDDLEKQTKIGFGFKLDFVLCTLDFVHKKYAIFLKR
jgi:hypothetical protein